MADLHTGGDGVDGEEMWAADMLYGAEPSAAPPTESLAVAVAADDADVATLCEDLSAAELDDDPAGASVVTEADDCAGDDLAAEPVDLDARLGGSPDPLQPGDCGDVNAGAKKTAVLLGAGLVVAVAAIVGALVMFSDNPGPSAARDAAPTPAAAAEPVSTTAAPPLEQDLSIAYTASANCPPGSTSAQALTDTASDSAWVCVRGAPGSAVDGQVLNVDLGRTYQVVAVEATSGWVAKTPGGKEEWLQHRVVTRLQYIFFNGNEVEIFSQDTGNTHGPVTTPLPKKVLASRVKVIVLQTSRPPASPLPSADPAAGAQPGFGDSVLGPVGAPLSPDMTANPDPHDLSSPNPGADPVDYTFAMSSLKFIGHLPN